MLWITEYSLISLWDLCLLSNTTQHRKHAHRREGRKKREREEIKKKDKQGV